MPLPRVTPPGPTEQHIRALVAEHGVKYVETASDRFAVLATELSGDAVQSDEVADLLLALMRANVIDGPTRLRLHFRYLNERRASY